MRVVLALAVFVMTIQQLVLRVDGGEPDTDCGANLKDTVSCPVVERSYLKCLIGPFTNGRRFFFKGMVNKMTRFSLNLMDMYGYSRSLHLDFRTSYASAGYLIVVNNQFRGRWGNDEVHQYTKEDFPIKLNEEFCIEIIARSNKYEVKFNNEHLLDFVYRKETSDPGQFPLLLTENDVVVSRGSYTP